MKIASRYLLPLEILMSVILLSWGFSGWLGRGLLWKTLAAQGMNAEWGLVLCFIGGTQFFVCTLELCKGRRWPWQKIHAAVTARYWLAFASAVIWLYVLYVMLTVRGAGAVFSLGLQAPACLAFSVWAFVGNLKVALILDPAVPTERLKSRIRAEREDLARGL